MKIKRYLGSNTQEAILKVKMDLGSEAVILNTRKIRQKGFFKLFAKPMVEILAAIDDDLAVKGVSNKNIADKNVKAVPMRNEDSSQKIRQSLSKEESFQKTEKIIKLEDKVLNMEIMLNKIYEGIYQTGKKEDQHSNQESQTQKQQYMEQIYNNLVKNDVDPDLAKKIVASAGEKIGEINGLSEVSAEVYKTISTLLGKPEIIKLKTDSKPTIILFVGPTGVGKTTTLAKLAANYSLNCKKEVGLITADTYRIAAVDQLRTYAEIIGIPISVVYSVSDIKGAIEEYREKDIIFIDTAGISYNNKSQYDELKVLVDEAQADEIFLVLSSSISMRNCKEILKNYQFLNDFKLIFTKLDETIVNGIILNARFLTNKSLSYITNGQSVPDDIEVANIDTVTKKMLGA